MLTPAPGHVYGIGSYQVEFIGGAWGYPVPDKFFIFEGMYGEQLVMTKDEWYSEDNQKHIKYISNGWPSYTEVE